MNDLDELFSLYSRYYLTGEPNLEEQIESLKSKIKEQIIKGYKWDNHNCGTYGCIMCDHDKMEQENKQLKEKLRKFEILQYTPEQMEIKLNERTFYMVELEKYKKVIDEIDKWVNSLHNRDFTICKQILSKLGDKK